MVQSVLAGFGRLSNRKGGRLHRDFATIATSVDSNSEVDSKAGLVAGVQEFYRTTVLVFTHSGLLYQL
jgi:hypothetical protein